MRGQAFRRGAYDVLLCVWIIGYVFPLQGCDEVLPPREKPRQVLELSVGVSTGEVFIDPAQPIPLTTTGSFFLTVENTYTEVLQDSVGVALEIEIWLKDHPDVRAIVRSDDRDLLNPGVVSGGLATLKPNQSAQFLTQWNQKTDGGKWFWCYSGNYHYVVPPSGYPYFLSDAIEFEARARVQLFKHIQAEQTDLVPFQLQYRIYADPLPSCGE